MAVGKVRLKDVAERAGVAVNTASTILNRRSNSWASKETEERVFAAARELKYRPNRAAVALQSGKFRTVGLLVADLENPYYTHFSTVFGNMVAEQGYDLVIESWQSDLEREKKSLEEMVHRNVDGLVLFVSDLEAHREFLERQSKLGFPIVVFAMPGESEVPVDVVVPEFSDGLQEAAEFLYELGHRRFSFLAARTRAQRIGGRPGIFSKHIEGFNDATVEIVDCGPTLGEARDVGRLILEKENRPTAIVALNDYTAIGVIRAAIQMGLNVPRDVSVVGIDGIPIGEHLMVSISTLVQNYKGMAAKAVEFLMDRIDGEEDHKPRRADFPAVYIQRDSVGPVHHEGGLD